ncbi:MAG: efflux RND transporter periplasmic adaptor subunit [Candidatus Omnitrophota bacterium]|nr:efflux RND transporter periplasmic adaptor subunit [Candidatus Omnitrophota bacterium]
MDKFKSKNAKIKTTIKNSKFLILTCGFAFLIFSFTFSYAQHEAHQTPSQTKEEAGPKKTAAKKDVYYCPMHPAYTSDRPGDCPICNMKLVKKPASPAGGEEARLANAQEGQGIYISPEKQQLIGVKIDQVIYRPLVKIIRTAGRVAFDPELYKTQAEYIEAAKTLEKIKESGQGEVIKRAEALVEAATLRLKLQGLDIKQIEGLEKDRENDESLLISSLDSDFAWVYAAIYEYELEWVKIGQEALITATAYPGREFKGKIVAIDPVFNAMTRSVRARIKVENIDGLLKPDMYVDVEMNSDLGAHLAVPKEAIMDSGLRKIVFLSLDSGRFKSVEVRTGLSTEEYAQVLEGLKEGDTVVVSGNFLIDSESKLKSALEGTGHQH